MVDPNGSKANLACLKCCKPKGIPTIVKQKKMPIAISSIAIAKPPSRIQIILNKNEAPLLPKWISFPNGAADIFANLKHCFPTGTPIIVIDHKTPTTIQVIQLINPPKINHTIFPNNFNRLAPLKLS